MSSFLDDCLFQKVQATSRLWRVRLDGRLRPLGLTQAGWMTLARIAQSSEPQSQTVLADRLGIEGASLVSMIDRLVRAGLVEREVSSQDRRVKYVKLTPAGQDMCAQVEQEASAFRHEILSDLDPRGVQQALTLLEGVRARLEA